MSNIITIPAAELGNYVGQNFIGHGVLASGGLVSPGEDIVVATFGDGFGRAERTFMPTEQLQVEIAD
ncbi:hypothetical protein [Nocardia sp. NPDC060249]|uniref:hypothetical protein n=1 Tax=Nocardia sp. NPDC060249 TaxID=3347082 RepID=UPI0036473A55